MMTPKPARTAALDSGAASTGDAPTSVRRQRPLRGLTYFAVALLLFACLDGVVKYLTAHYPVPLIAWVRYSVQLLLMTVLLAPSAGRALFSVQRRHLVLVRSVCLVVLTLLMNSALKLLPLAEATAIVFIAPLLVVVLARPWLGERITPVRGASVVAGFLGVLLVVRPSGTLDTLGVALALLAALSNTFYQLLSRLLGGTENAVSMLYNSALVGTVCFGLLAPWFWAGPEPTVTYVALFVSMGVLGGLGHFFFTKAFQEAPASYLAPVSYLQLVWAGLLGWLVFHQFPDPVALAGMAVIAVSGVTAAIYGRHRA